MPTLEQQLSDAIAAQNALTQAVAAKKGEIDATVAAQKQAYDRWIAGTRSEYLEMHRQALNPAIIDKAFFGLTDAANVEGADRSMSKWKIIGIGQVYAREGCVVNVDTACCAINYGGYYETPQYATDKCATFWQFVVANTTATSDQINQRIRDAGITINTTGGWSDDAQMLKTTCVQIPGLHPYSTLWARLVNRVVSGTGSPQDVSRFGGSPNLRARFAEIYMNINYP